MGQEGPGAGSRGRAGGWIHDSSRRLIKTILWKQSKQKVFRFPQFPSSKRVEVRYDRNFTILQTTIIICGRKIHLSSSNPLLAQKPLGRRRQRRRRRRRRRRQHGGGGFFCLPKKNAISPFFDASGHKIFVLLSALVERFGVSCMQDFQAIQIDFFYKKIRLKFLSIIFSCF